MKTRQGFVSNSSTTSFCIYGIVAERNNLLDENVELPYNKYRGEYELSGYLFTKIKELGLNLKTERGQEYTQYIGADIDMMTEDETKREFYKRIENDLKKLFKNVKCSWHEESWYDG